ncbi:MAG: DUF1294 domain-containing protein [Flavobacterium sp.]|nr:DUF1294 domain-containing protein [Flavobacterium sp.]
MNTILIYFFAINIVGFFLIWYDKNQSKNNQYRVSEKTLLTIVAFGGIAGSSLGMFFFRHKTSKTSYLLKFFGIIIVQVLIFVFCFKYFSHYKI